MAEDAKRPRSSSFWAEVRKAEDARLSHGGCRCPEDYWPDPYPRGRLSSPAGETVTCDPIVVTNREWPWPMCSKAAPFPRQIY